jgi:hypothetical protein
MKILTIRFSYLRNEAHYQFLLLLKKLFETFPSVASIVNALLQQFYPLLTREGALVDAVMTGVCRVSRAAKCARLRAYRDCFVPRNGGPLKRVFKKARYDGPRNCNGGPLKRAFIRACNGGMCVRNDALHDFHLFKLLYIIKEQIV